MNAKVLVVDDESTTRRLVSYALQTIHVEVVGAEDGTQALEIAQEEGHNWGMALLDINLPDMDGFQVLAHFKAMPQMQEVPIIIFTARNHPGDENEALEAGAAGFLYKPFSTQELRALVTRHLGRE